MKKCLSCLIVACHTGEINHHTAFKVYRRYGFILRLYRLLRLPSLPCGEGFILPPPGSWHWSHRLIPNLRCFLSLSPEFSPLLFLSYCFQCSPSLLKIVSPFILILLMHGIKWKKFLLYHSALPSVRSILNPVSYKSSTMQKY